MRWVLGHDCAQRKGASLSRSFSLRFGTRLRSPPWGTVGHSCLLLHNRHTRRGLVRSHPALCGPRKTALATAGAAHARVAARPAVADELHIRRAGQDAFAHRAARDGKKCIRQLHRTLLLASQASPEPTPRGRGPAAPCLGVVQASKAGGVPCRGQGVRVGQNNHQVRWADSEFADAYPSADAPPPWCQTCSLRLAVTPAGHAGGRSTGTRAWSSCLRHSGRAPAA